MNTPYSYSSEQDSAGLSSLRHGSDQLITQNMTTFENRPGLPFVIEDQILELEGSLQRDEPSISSSDDSIKSAPWRVPMTPKKQMVRLETAIGGWSNQVWKDGALRIMANVVRFVIFMLTNSEKFKFTFITAKSFNVIDDRASQYEFYLEQNLIRDRNKKALKQYLKDMLIRSELLTRINFLPYIASKLKVIDPSSMGKILWDVFVLLVLTIQMIFVPIKICFYLNIDSQPMNFLLNQLPVCVYIIEIALNFTTGYYEHGQVMTDQGQIAMKYLKTSFFFDLVTFLPFFISIIDQDAISNIFQFALLFRLGRLTSISNNIEEQLNLREHYTTQIDVLGLLIQFLFISHVFGCWWYYIAMIQADYGIQTTWLTELSPNDSTWYEGYITSIYWSSITQLTIGYGDIHPVTIYEKMYVIVVAVISSVVFGYTISNVGYIFSQINESKKSQRYKMSLVQAFVSKRNVNKHLSNRVKKFFEYFLKLDQSRDSDCQLILSKLAPDLKFQLNIDIYKQQITKSRLFALTFSIEFIEQVCQLIQEKQYPAKETIFLPGTTVQEIYFIISGQIEISLPAKNGLGFDEKQLTQLSNGNVLGERYFMTDETTPYQARTTSYTKVSYMKKQDFLELLAKYPIEQQKFKEAQNKLIMQEQIKAQGCELCYSNHKFSQCPFTFYQPNIRKVVKKQDVGQQKRVYRDRRHLRSHISLKDKVWVQEQAIVFGIEHDYYHEDSLDASLLEKFDINFIEGHPKQVQKYPTGGSESSANTLVKQKLGIVQESQESVKDKYGRQGSNNMIRNPSSMRNLNQLMSKLKTKDFKVPDKVTLQNLSNEESSEQSPLIQLKKSSKTLYSQATISCVDVSHILYQDYLKLFKIDSMASEIQEDKWQEYKGYYPKFNVNNVISVFHDKLSEIRKKKQSKVRQRTANRFISSFQNLGERSEKRNFAQIRQTRKRSNVDFILADDQSRQHTP